MAIRPKITIAGNVVIASGTVVVSHGSPLRIIPALAGLTPLTFEFDFVTNALLPVQVQTENLPNNIIRVHVRNFDHPDGAALLAPLRVGQIANRDLFLQISIYTIGNASAQIVRTISYTFTLAGNADVN